jgi:hypothetical protein
MSAGATTMLQKRPKIVVQIACTRWLRFRIANDAGQFWTGTAWADCRSGALLYAHAEVVRADVKKLNRQLREAEDE